MPARGWPPGLGEEQGVQVPGSSLTRWPDQAGWGGRAHPGGPSGEARGRTRLSRAALQVSWSTSPCAASSLVTGTTGRSHDGALCLPRSLARAARAAPRRRPAASIRPPRYTRVGRGRGVATCRCACRHSRGAAAGGGRGTKRPRSRTLCGRRSGRRFSLPVAAQALGLVRSI